MRELILNTKYSGTGPLGSITKHADSGTQMTMAVETMLELYEETSEGAGAVFMLHNYHSASFSKAKDKVSAFTVTTTLEECWKSFTSCQG